MLLQVLATNNGGTMLVVCPWLNYICLFVCLFVCRGVFYSFQVYVEYFLP